jgi:hypothetical protein
MAKAARLTIVEAEEIVPIGALEANDIDLPGIFVDRIVPSTPRTLKLRSFATPHRPALPLRPTKPPSAATVSHAAQPRSSSTASMSISVWAYLPKPHLLFPMA